MHGENMKLSLGSDKLFNVLYIKVGEEITTNNIPIVT